MKKRTIILTVLSALLLLALLCGCSASADMQTAPNDANKTQSAEESAGLSGNTAFAATGSVQQNRKIIYDIHMSIQTREFDALLEKLEREIEAVGGYLSGSDISGNGYESNEKRSAYLTVRVPADQNEAFAAFVSDNCTVTGKSVSTEDVTSQYVDTESRLRALHGEQAALEALLAQATSMEDMLSIRSQLTDVIYEIESYQAQLNTYDELIDYATVSLSIYEVDVEKVVDKQNVWQKIGEQFSGNLRNVGTFFSDLFVFLVTCIPYLAIVALPALPLCIVLPLVKRKRAKKATAAPEKQPPETL